MFHGISRYQHMGRQMAGCIFKSRFPIYSSVFLGLSLFFYSPAQGDDHAMGAGEVAPKAALPGNVAKIDEDIAAARKELSEKPGNASLHVRLGNLLISKGALDEAMLVFEQALKLNPRAGDAKTGRGMVLARKGNLKEAAQALQDALFMNPNPVRTHYELGVVYEKLGDLDKAIAEMKEGIRKHEQGR